MPLNLCPPLLGTERLNGNKRTRVLLVEGDESAIEEALAAGWKAAVAICEHPDHLPANLKPALMDRPVIILSNNQDKADRLIEHLDPVVKSLRLAFGTVDNLDYADDHLAAVRDRRARSRTFERPLPGTKWTESTCMAEVVQVKVQWLWPGYLPLGKVVMFDGRPEVGKSTITIDWTARVSTGKPWPDGDPCEAAGVVLLSHEDDKADTIAPRLTAAGADLHKVQHIDQIHGWDKGGEPFARYPVLPDDTDQIEAEVIRLGARLVVIDPLYRYLSPRVNPYKDQEVRQALAPLQDMAQRHGCTVVIVRHPTKDTSRSAMNQGGGSIGIIGQARAGLIAVVDPNDPTKRLLASTKSNLAKKPPSRFYSLIGDEDTEMASIEWGPTDPRSADELAVAPAPDRTSGSAATAWVRNYLTEAGGEADSDAVLTAGDAAGFSVSALNRAKRNLKVKSRKAASMDGGWTWYLAEDVAEDVTADDPTSSTSSLIDEEARSSWDRGADPLGVAILKRPENPFAA